MLHSPAKSMAYQLMMNQYQQQKLVIFMVSKISMRALKQQQIFYYSKEQDNIATTITIKRNIFFLQLLQETRRSTRLSNQN
jgi:hypothetical protein